MFRSLLIIERQGEVSLAGLEKSAEIRWDLGVCSWHSKWEPSKCEQLLKTHLLVLH